jgi:hypothetical protein
MIKPDEFMKLVRRGDVPPVFALGTIPDTYTTGRPTIEFDGESSASTRTYPYLSSYTPTAEDRVLLARVGQTWVVLGKVE